MAPQGAFRDIRPNGLPLAKIQRLRTAASSALGPEMPGICGYPGRDEWRPEEAAVCGGGGSLPRTRLCLGIFPDLQGIIREFSIKVAFWSPFSSANSRKSLQFLGKFPKQLNGEFSGPNREWDFWLQGRSLHLERRPRATK